MSTWSRSCYVQAEDLADRRLGIGLRNDEVGRAGWLRRAEGKGKATGHLCRALISSNSLLALTDAEMVSLFACEHSCLPTLILIAGMMD
jgi:hypothetical protein